MPGLREAIRRVSVAAVTKPPPAPVHLPRETEKLDRLFGPVPVTAPSDDHLDAVYAKLKEIARASPINLSALTNRELADAAWVILTQYGRDTPSVPLAASIDFQNTYLKELHSRGGQAKRATAMLLHCLMLYYPTELPGFRGLCDSLALYLLPRLTGPRIERWRDCTERSALLAVDGSSTVARQLLDADQAPDAVLDSCCLGGMLASGAFAQQAFRQMISLVQVGLIRGQPPQQRLNRLLWFARGPQPRAQLRFPSHRAALLNGLLLPFAEGSPEPGAADQIKSFVLESVGDPRLSVAGWHQVDTRARQVMLGWLVRETLEDFFRLLEHAAQSDATARRHWSARKAFLTRYLNAGAISDAWVVLGKKALLDAPRLLSSSQDTYGRFATGAGVQANHSAIILRMGGLTITEWSHSGKLRIWSSEQETPPPLYQPRYFRSQLVKGAEQEIIHNSGWQQNVSDLIFDLTGIHP